MLLRSGALVIWNSGIGAMADRWRHCSPVVMGAFTRSGAHCCNIGVGARSEPIIGKDLAISATTDANLGGLVAVELWEEGTR